MKPHRQIDWKDCLGKWTLIVGDVNTGKTTLSARFLASMCAEGLASRIAVVDLAPEIPAGLALKKTLRGAGGHLIPPVNDTVYLGTPLLPPRLSSKSEEEAVAKAQENKGKIESLFEAFAASGRDILFVNDLTLYLQAGTAEKFVKLTGKAETVIANGYYGKKLGGGAMSERERRETEALIAHASPGGEIIQLKHVFLAPC